MTLESSDNQLINRVPDSGKIICDIQVMRDGIKIHGGSYCGKGMTRLLYMNKGVHEPQEESVFEKVLTQLPSDAVMLELGSFWGYYSMWFKKTIPHGACYLIEPDRHALLSGKLNFRLNNYSGAFFNYCVSDIQENAKIPVVTIDNFLEQNAIKRLAILHSDENLEKYQDSIRNYFKPIAQIQKNVEAHYKVAKQDADVVIGVHIRRGDYVEFAEGKYFYNDQEYQSKMHQLQESMPEKKIKFVICSNEDIALNHFSGLSVLKGPGHLVEDMYALALCDFIMGPPSTFTLWASFYGKKPLYQIRDLNQPASFDKFTYLPPSVLYNF